MWQGVNVLKHSPIISDLTERDFFQLNLSDISRKLGEKRCRAGLGSVWELLTCWLRKGVLKQELLHTHLTTIFRANNFQNS